MMPYFQYNGKVQLCYEGHGDPNGTLIFQA